jgi:dCTP deaminase
MGVLPDFLIKKQVKITPFDEGASHPGAISYGLSSYGYDVRVGKRFKVFSNVHSQIVDPKQFSERTFVDVEGDHCIIPPNSFALGETVEYIEVPRDVIGLCVGKSTYARCGIIVNVTPLEPERSAPATRTRRASTRTRAASRCRLFRKHARVLARTVS